MGDILFEPDAITKSRLHSTVISKVRKEMMRNPSATRPKAKGKWLEIVYCDGNRFAVSCKKEDSDIVVTTVRFVPKKTIRSR